MSGAEDEAANGARRSSDPYAHDDGAYVLDALSPGEHAEFEAHLPGCVECRERVATVAPVADLLAAAGAMDFGKPTAIVPDSVRSSSAGQPTAETSFLEDPIPDTVLAALLRAARHDRARRRRFTAALAGVAAACLVALAVVAWPTSGTATAPAREMQAVAASPVHATAALVARTWGTEIDLACRYDSGVNAYLAYDLVVIGTDGVQYPAGSWTLTPGAVTHFTGGTALPPAQIARVQITLPGGPAILALSP